jgi:hypothetical protein
VTELAEATSTRNPGLLPSLLLTATVAILSGYALSTAGLDSGFVLVSALGILLLYSLVSDSWRYAPWDARVWLWFAFSVSILASAIADRSPAKVSNLLVLAYISLALVITMLVDFRNFIEVFLHTMRILTIIALVAHVAFIGYGISPPFERVVNVNGVVYANGYLVFLIFWGDAVVPRTMSIFWEPGLYASFLTFAIIFELCFRNARPRRISLILFTAGILISMSTAGYLLLLLLAMLWYFRGVRQGRPLPFLVSIAVGLWLYIQGGAIVESLVSFNREMFYKVQNSDFFGGTRWQSPLLNLKIFADSPILGSGYGGASATYAAGMVRGNIAAQTSTSTFYLAAFGIPGFLYSASWIVSVLNLRGPNVYARGIILFCILIILNKEPHDTILVTNCLLFYFVGESQPVRPWVAATSYRKDLDA